ncbi:MAG: endonuclease MutS2, partial [Clostridia bacterium]|nr:endonuclease MutS2 [Clostridia bacterium]
MDKSVFKTLEFDKILDRLASFTESEAVKKRIFALCPHAFLLDAQNAQKETTEAVTTCLKLGNPPVNFSVRDITGAVRRSEIGGMLSPLDLMSVSRVLYVARRIKSYIGDSGDDAVILHGLADGIVTNKPLEDSINSAILSETEIADDASADLSAIRRKMKTLNAKIRESLDNMIRSETYKKYLQDPIVTIRSDRYVLPVKSEYRAEV